MTTHSPDDDAGATAATIESLLRAAGTPGHLTIGIAGGSGSGKSTIADSIAEGLRPKSVEIIGLDRFFKPADELPRYYSSHHGEPRADYNRPDSLRVDEMVEFCGRAAAVDVVILDGHLALCYGRMRQLMDIKCFVQTDVEQMLVRRTERNLTARYGGDLDTILNYNRECVEPNYNRYILPARDHADLVIPNDNSSAQARDEVIASLCHSILNRRER
jgi:uridine kinase